MDSDEQLKAVTRRYWLLSKMRSEPDLRPETVWKMFDEDVRGWVDEIDQLIADRSWNEAFGELLAYTTYINAAVSASAPIIDRLATFAAWLSAALSKIAGALNVESFSISVSVPVGISVTLSFTPAG